MMLNLDHSSVTDVRYAPKGTTFLSLKSSNLLGRGEVSIYLPPSASGQKDLSFVILLHGVYGSHFSWLYQAGAHFVLEQLIAENKSRPFMLVMPSDGLTGDGSGYMKHHQKNHEAWIVDDVIFALKHYFLEISDRSKAYISGLSMGGYGALRIGMKYHHLFSGISAHSSITDLDDFQTFIEEDIRSQLAPRTVEESSIIFNAKKYRDQLPPTRFDCGVEDPLIKSNRKLHKLLGEAKVAHKYEEFTGAHSYEYWTRHIADSFRYFSALES